MGHYDLGYEMEVELLRLFSHQNTTTKENTMEVTDVFSNTYLGTYYTIEDHTSIMMAVVKDDKVMVIPGGSFCSIDKELDTKKFERKALKALRDYLGD